SVRPAALSGVILDLCELGALSSALGSWWCAFFGGSVHVFSSSSGSLPVFSSDGCAARLRSGMWAPLVLFDR
ncbi:hypothetical protein KI387_031542, partial [Taxus chinensis]